MKDRISVPPIRAESVLIALTKGWPEPAELDWSTVGKRDREKIRNGQSGTKKNPIELKEDISLWQTEKKHKWWERGKKEREKIRENITAHRKYSRSTPGGHRRRRPEEMLMETSQMNSLTAWASSTRWTYVSRNTETCHISLHISSAALHFIV